MLADRHGFYCASATQMLGEELTRRGLPHERENKRAVSAEWRRKHGLGAIVDKAVEEAKAAGLDRLVVGSLRNPGEVDRVHELSGTVIWIDADPKVRYDRIQKSNRGRVEDAKTFEQFLSEEQAEMTPEGDSATLNMSGVKAKADRFLSNDTDNIEEFIQTAQKQLEDFL